MNNIAIELKNVTKEYVIHHEKPTLVEKFIKGKTERFKALNNISLTIRRGEHVGIVGPNGSGKTTLLKIIAGITTPSSGLVWTNGKIVSLIDLYAGFHSDLTGEQNIFLNGMLLGMTKQQINNNLKKIINFADLKSFIDAPLYTYSLGMVMRLGFSIAIHTKPEIMIFDEGIVVGDSSFQKKVQTAMNRRLTKSVTVIYVSHLYRLLKERCSRIVQLEKGQIVADGNISLLSNIFNPGPNGPKPQPRA